jgi:hypothetical protein
MRLLLLSIAVLVSLQTLEATFLLVKLQGPERPKMAVPDPKGEKGLVPNYPLKMAMIYTD